MEIREKFIQAAAAAAENIKERDYWLNALSGELTPSSFPADSPGPAPERLPGDHVAIPIHRDLAAKMLRLSNRSDVRLFILLAAGLNLLIHKYTGSTDIIVGTAIYRQDTPGELINYILALRNRVDPGMTFKTLLLEAKATHYEAVRHQDYPFDVLMYKLNRQVGSEEISLPDIAVVLENIHDKGYLNSISPNMVFRFRRREDLVEGELEYNPQRYEHTTSQRIAAHFVHLVEQGISRLDAPVSEAELLTAAEKRQVLQDFNDTARAYPGKTIRAGVEAQVEKTPRQTALVYRDQVFTYGELNRGANRLAGILRRRGVQPDHLAAIMMERSPAMVTGMLAVLKAGGAYMPIDPHFPEARVRMMLEDSRPSLLLTDAPSLAGRSYTVLQDLYTRRLTPELTPPRPQIRDLDALPLVDRSYVDHNKYTTHLGQAWIKHSLALFATRGCPYGCAYCHKIWPNRHVPRSAENIFREVQLYYRMGVKRFVIVDDVFNFDRENSQRFFRLIVENRLQIHLYFTNGLRGDTLTPDYIDLMVEAGTISIALALESASPRLQKLMGKHLNIDRLRENIQYLAHTYPQVILQVFLMHGFPTETEAEAEMTLDFIREIQWVHFPYINILRIYSNTRMEQLALQQGVSPEAIFASENQYYHELPETLPFSKNFSLKFQTDFLKDYFLAKERLLRVLPYQMKVFTPYEMVRKYRSYLRAEISDFDELLAVLEISREELRADRFIAEETLAVPDLDERIKAHFPVKSAGKGGLKVLLLDLSQFFSTETTRLDEVVDPPLALMYLMTYLHRQLGDQIQGRILKSRIDFDNFQQLREQLEEFKPDVIGLRTLTYYRDFFHRTAALIRQWGIEAPVITGGPYATNKFDALLQDRNIDLVVLGEGELTFCDVIEKIIAHQGQLPGENELRKIPGIAFLPEREKKRRAYAREILRPDEIMATPAQESEENPVPASGPGDLAYITYTSGSTGKPKGVMTQQENAANVLNWFAETYSLDRDSRVLQLTDFTFDPSVEQIFGALFRGAAVYLADREIIGDVSRLARFMDQRGITLINFVPPILEELLTQENRPLRLKTVISGGERLGETLKNRLLARGYRLYNHYGPTETTIDALTCRCTRDNVTLGKPIANSRVYILGEQDRLVAVGIPGELCLSGAGLARGYLNHPELTREKFPPNPFAHGDPVHSHLYRTGDMGRWLSSGEIQFLGRRDRQVKIRGYRIELGEIENHLCNYTGIADAVVMAVKTAAAPFPYLGAYVVPRQSDAPLDTMALREYLSRRLPQYMIPLNFIKLDHLPLLPNGKVDRNALPVQALSQPMTYIPPRDEIEKKMTTLWSEVLGIEADQIGIDANFFQLGGHSLKVTVLVSRLHQALQVKLTLAEVFQNPTIEGLARHIKAAAAERFVALAPVEEKEYYRVSAAQNRVYILCRLHPGETGYNTPVFVAVPGLERHRAETAFRQLIQRHESLRTSFEIIAGEPVQRIHRTEQVRPRLEAAEAASPQELESRLNEFIQPFDLAQPPLLRMGIVLSPDSGKILMLDMHHIISDGVSFNILIREFKALYQGQELPALEFRYRDYSEAQWDLKRNETFQAQESYWLKEFTGEIPVLDLPLDYPRPAFRDFTGNAEGFELDTQETAGLKQLGLEEEATLYMVLLAALNVLLARLSGQEDIVIGSPTAGRRHAHLDSIIGIFINTLALRNYPASGKTFAGFLKEVKANTLAAFENQEYPFEQLVNRVEVGRDPSRNPLFDVLLVMQNFQQESVEGDLLQENHPGTRPLQIKRSAKFDLSIYCSEVQGKIHFTFEYWEKIFKRETLHRFFHYFRQVVQAVVENRQGPLAEIEIISPEEKQKVLFDFNRTGADYPRDKTYYQLFREQAQRTPDQVALIGQIPNPKSQIPNKDAPFGRILNAFGEDISITYKELNRRSHQLAYLLKETGVGVDAIVGIMVERCVEMIVGILGISKVGAAYLPIDPDYPQERISYMLADSSAKILVTSPVLSEKIKKMSILNCQLLMVNEMPSQRRSSINNFQLEYASLAYVIYTSGSTGRPKGVTVSHRALVNFIEAMAGCIPFTRGDAILSLTTVSFDIFALETLLPLTRGSRVVIGSREEQLDAAATASRLEKEHISVFQLTPSMLSLLVGHEAAAASLKIPRYLLVGGEAFPLALLEKVRPLTTGKIFNLYGPTETTIWSAVKDVTQQDLNIGLPIANTQIYILDKNKSPQPIEIVGELFIGGDGLARGYLNQPGLTAEKFLRVFSCPRSYRSHRSYIYQTGDLARWLPDGNIECLGRIDHQVKVRGFRIELEEIERVLQAHHKIKEAVVIVKGSEGDGSNKYICAYIVPGAGEIDNQDLVLSELREYLLKKLPDYMVPSYFTVLEEIPLTPNGKVDRKVLEAAYVHLGTGTAYVPPGTQMEELVAETWKEVLKVEKVGIHDSFFELGGNSMGVILVNNKLKEALNKDLPVALLYRYFTISSFARYLTQGVLEQEQGVEAGLDMDREEEIRQGKQRVRQSMRRRRI